MVVSNDLGPVCAESYPQRFPCVKRSSSISLSSRSTVLAILNHHSSIATTAVCYVAVVGPRPNATIFEKLIRVQCRHISGGKTMPLSGGNSISLAGYLHTGFKRSTSKMGTTESGSNYSPSISSSVPSILYSWCLSKVQCARSSPYVRMAQGPKASRISSCIKMRTPLLCPGRV